MDIFDEEVTGLLRAFAEAGLRYLLVGGFAVNMHGHRRATGNVDVWMEETPTNRKALRAALRIAGYGDLELMISFPRLDSGLDQVERLGIVFVRLYQRAVVDKVHDVDVRYLHLDDLLRAKRASGRNKDLGDLDFLLGQTS